MEGKVIKRHTPVAWHHDGGQSLVEYGLGIAVIAVAVALVLVVLGGGVSGLLEGVEGGMGGGPPASGSPGASASATATATATPTASASATPSGAPTATPTPVPVCTVPNVIGARRNSVQGIWSAAGFTTTAVLNPGTGNYVVGTQNPPASVVGNCATTTLTVGP